MAGLLLKVDGWAEELRATDAEARKRSRINLGHQIRVRSLNTLASQHSRPAANETAHKRWEKGIPDCFNLLIGYHPMKPCLVHLADQGIDLVLPITQVASLNEMLELPWSEPAIWVAQLEGPKEVARLLEIRAHGVDLVNQILHAHNAVLAQMVLDQLIVGEGNALLFNLAVATLVDQFTDGLEGGVTVGNIGFDDLKHLQSSFREADEYAVVDLKEAEKLQSLAGFRSHLGDTEKCKHLGG